MAKMKFITPLALAALALMLLGTTMAGCSARGGAQPGSETQLPQSETYFIFDTIVTLRVYDAGMTAEHFDDVERLLQRIDSKMNRRKDGSEIFLVNERAGHEAVAVSEETMLVVKEALEYARSSSGSFDPTVGPLVDLWGIGSEQAALPSPAAIDERLALVDYNSVTLDEAGRTIRLEKPGMAIDLGAIAKGYAADVIADYLQQNGFHSAIIDLGGNIMAMGGKPDGSDWRIGIQAPDKARGQHLGAVNVKNKTIVTSGVYERYFEENGKLYHHIFNTHTGYPVDNDLLSVTIVTDVSMDADAMSTAVFALGLEAGLRYMEARSGSDAIFVTADREVVVTSGLASGFQITNEEYQLAERLR